MGDCLVTLAFISLGVLLVGCTPSDIILDVDGRKLSIAERDDEIDLRVKLLRMANPEMNETIAESRRKAFLASMERHFIDETILLRVACDRNLTATTDEIARHMDGLSRFLDGLSSSEQALAKSIAKREVLCEKAKQSITAETSDKVLPDELDQALNRLKAYAEMVAVTNRLIYAHATNVWREVLGGRDFATAARMYSEADDGSSCEWGQFPLAAFAEEPALKCVVAKMHVGDVSQPIEGDNGLMIVRLKGIDAAAMPQRYDLERIFFKLPEEAPRMTVGEVAKIISTEKRRRSLEAQLNELRKEIRVIRH